MLFRTFLCNILSKLQSDIHLLFSPVVSECFSITILCLDPFTQLNWKPKKIKQLLFFFHLSKRILKRKYCLEFQCLDKYLMSWKLLGIENPFCMR